MFDFEIIPSLGNVKSYHGGYQNPKYRRQEDNTMSQKGRKEKNNTQQNNIKIYSLINMKSTKNRWGFQVLWILIHIT